MSLPAPRPGVAGARGLPLAAARRAGAPQHQRESVRAAARRSSTRGSRALAHVDLNRYPDRAATDLRAGIAKHLGQPAERIFAANGSNEVLQTLLLAYGGPGRRALVFEPTYALHSHICRITGTEVVTGERDADFRISPTEVAHPRRERAADGRVRVQPQQPHRHGRGARDARGRARAVIDHGDGARSSSTRPTASSPTHSALDLVADDVPARRRAHLLEGVVARRAAARLLRRAAGGGGASSRRSCCRTTSRPPPRPPGVAALAFRDEMDERVARARGRAAPDGRGARPAARASPCTRRARTSCSIRADGDGHALWQGLVDRGVLVRDFSRWPRLDDCLRDHRRHRRRERPLPRGAPRDPDRERGDLIDARSAQLHRATKETTVDLRLVVDGSGDASASTGIPFFDHMLEQLGQARRVRSRRSRPPATSRSTSTTPWRTSASCSAPRSRRRSATRPACAGSRRRSCRSTRRSCRWRSTSRAARSSCTRSTRSCEWIGTFDPQLCEEFWRAFAFAAGITLHIRSLSGRQRAPRHRGVVQGRGARRCATRCEIEGTGVPSTKGTL